MKKLYFILLTLLIISCGAKKSAPPTALFEILSQQENGGAKIEFYEIITDVSEMNMLLGDENLKGKIKKKDIETANFLILNMGEKVTGGYSITVDKITETPENIVISVKQKAPKPRQLVTTAFTAPYCIVKINSKKEIVFK
jgi:PrcB C-terminal